MKLALHGPFAATDRGLGLPLARSPLASQSGIYFWAVRCGGTYRVAYLGKTTRSFAQRIREEVTRFRRGLDGYFDLEAFQRGSRVAIPAPESGAEALLESLIECSPVFVAPIEARDILALEAHLIRTIQGSASCADARAFLAHGQFLVRRLPPEPVEITFPQGITVDGLCAAVA